MGNLHDRVVCHRRHRRRPLLPELRLLTMLYQAARTGMALDRALQMLRHDLNHSPHIGRCLKRLEFGAHQILAHCPHYWRAGPRVAHRHWSPPC